MVGTLASEHNQNKKGSSQEAGPRGFTFLPVPYWEYCTGLFLEGNDEALQLQ